MALKAGYRGIKKYIADKLNRMNPGDSFATDAEIAATAQQIYADMGVVGAKNFIPMTVEVLKAINTSGTWSDKTYTLNGGTFELQTDADDNIIGIKVNGTFSANSSFNLWMKPKFDGTMMFNGCPAGGSETTFSLSYSNYVNSAYRDYGNGVSVTQFNATTYPNARMLIVAMEGTISNKVFKPMLCLISNSDPTYQPYAETNLQLTQNIATKADITALGTQEGATASRLYHPGEHFYRDGNTCEVIGNADVAQGATWTLNTNYKVKSVYDSLIKKATVTVTTTATTGVSIMYDGADRNIIAVKAVSGEKIVLPFLGSGATKIYCKVLNFSDLSPATSQEVALEYYYID